MPDVKSCEQLNLDNPEHAGFLFDLAMACRDYFFNDFDTDVILLLHKAHQMIAQGLYLGFLCKVGDKPVGVIWVEKDQYGIGYIRCGIMPEYRNGFYAKWFLERFIAFCFNTLNIRKLVATFSRDQGAIERVLRQLNFLKEGYLKEELLKDGEPVDLLRLELTQSRYLANYNFGEKDVA